MKLKCSVLLIVFFLSAVAAQLYADATWGEYAEYVKNIRCIPPTPTGDSYVSVKSGEAVRLRFPVPKLKPLGFWADAGSIVALSGKGTSYQLVVHVDSATGPVAYEGPVIADGDAWNAANRTPINLTDKLTGAHVRQGYIDVFAVCVTKGDDWALYRNNDGRPIVAYIAELTPQVKQAMDTAKALQSRGIAVIPAPQKMTLSAGDFHISHQTRIQVPSAASAEDVFAARDLAEQLSDALGSTVPVVRSNAAAASGVIQLKRGSGKPESYALRVTPTSIIATGADAAGVFYAAQTIAQLAHGKGDTARIPACEVQDYPAQPLRAMQYDIARGQTVNVEFMKRVIREFARCKLNGIMYYGEDDYKFVKYPFLGRPGTFTPEKAKELSEYAHKYHMQLIPQYESLGHAAAVLGHPELKDLQEAGSSWVYCTCNPKVWEFLDNVFRELTEQFPYSQYIHVGADEFEDGFGLCPQCKEKVAQIGLGGLYAEHMNKLNELCKKYHRTMLFWPSHGASTPERSYLTLKNAKIMQRDCIPTEWIYHGPSTYPEIKQYLDAGFKDCWTSPAVVCFSVIWPDYETSFRGIRGMLRAGAEDGVKGTCTTTWEWMFGGMFNNSWLGMLYVPECAWSLGCTPRDDYERRFAAHFYGLDGADLGRRINDTLAQPFPISGAGAQNRNSGTIRDLLWCAPTQVRAKFSLRMEGLSAAAPEMLKAADAALERATALRKDSTRNADLLQSAELAFRLHRLAAQKLIAIDTAATQYTEAGKTMAQDPKAAAGKANDAATTIASLIPEYEACAEAFKVDIDQYGHYAGDRDQCLNIAKALGTLSTDIKEAARKLAAGEEKTLPTGPHFGLNSGSYARIGSWAPDQVTPAGNEMRIDVSARIRVAGDYAVQWQYTGGAHALSVHRVALVCDGQEIAVDQHDAFTGSGDNANIFTLKVPEAKPGAKYEIVANIKGEGGNNSNGDVWLITPEK